MVKTKRQDTCGKQVIKTKDAPKKFSCQKEVCESVRGFPSAFSLLGMLNSEVFCNFARRYEGLNLVQIIQMVLIVNNHTNF
jgi:hypothetical protein